MKYCNKSAPKPIITRTINAFIRYLISSPLLMTPRVYHWYQSVSVTAVQIQTSQLLSASARTKAPLELRHLLLNHDDHPKPL